MAKPTAEQPVTIWCPQDGDSQPLWARDADAIVKALDPLCGPHKIRPYLGEFDPDDVTLRGMTYGDGFDVRKGD